MENFDFGELKNDSNFIAKFKASNEAVRKIEESISAALEISNFDELTTEEKVKYDLFLSYSINSLFFMYLKMNGENVSEHGIKYELIRIKEAMIREKQIQDLKKRPTVNQDAAKRFVRSGLYDVKEKNEEFKRKNQSKENPNPHNKKRKFNQDD